MCRNLWRTESVSCTWFEREKTTYENHEPELLSSCVSRRILRCSYSCRKGKLLKYLSTYRKSWSDYDHVTKRKQDRSYRESIHHTGTLTSQDLPGILFPPWLLFSRPVYAALADKARNRHINDQIFNSIVLDHMKMMVYCVRFSQRPGTSQIGPCLSSQECIHCWGQFLFSPAEKGISLWGRRFRSIFRILFLDLKEYGNYFISNSFWCTHFHHYKFK